MSSPELTQAALDLTIKAVKHHHPSVALKVQNLMAGTRNIEQSYTVNLDAKDISIIVSSLTNVLNKINDPVM